MKAVLRIFVAFTCYAWDPTWVTRCPRRLLRCCMNSVMCLIFSQEMQTTKKQSLRRTQVKSCVFAARLSNPKENGVYCPSHARGERTPCCIGFRTSAAKNSLFTCVL